MPTAAAAAVTPASWGARWRERVFRHHPSDRDPVVLRHSRIYILPTRRGLAFLGTLLIMLVTSLNYALSLGFVATFLLTGLAAASLLHTFRNLAGIELSPLAAGEAFAGNPLSFTIAIAGGAAARHALSLTAAGASSMVEVPPDGAVPALLEIPTTRRGRVFLGRVTLASDYPLGLWRAWAYAHFPLSGIVYPAPELNAPPLPAGAAGDDAQPAVRGEDADLAGLKGYQTGDPLQRVAWKAVARGGAWYTKQFDGAGGGGPAALDWRTLPGSLAHERRIARLSAWVLAAERAARPFTLSAPGVALAAGQGREHRRAALTALALVPDHT